MKKQLNFYMFHADGICSKAIYTLEVYADLIGVKLKRVYEIDHQTDLIYSEELPDEKFNGLWIKAISKTEWCASPVQKISWSNGLPIIQRNWKNHDIKENNNIISFDIFHSGFSLLTGVFEQEQKKNETDVPIFEHSYFERSGLLDKPFVLVYSLFLLKKLEDALNAKFEREPFWPNGKKYCIVNSHDVDEPIIDPPMTGYFIRSTFNNCSSYNIKSLVKFFLRESLNGFRKDIPNDVNFCFDKWMHLEDQLKAKSAFYVAVKTSSHKNCSKKDVVYNFRNKYLVNAMHEAIDKGWEIGLHASINAKDSGQRIIDEKKLLEEVLKGYKVKGLRHHFWALGKDTSKTFLMHKAAGFLYDSSLGMNDVVGFRRGMAHPFFLFDMSGNEAINLLQIPPTLMDGGIFYKETNTDEGRKKIIEHFLKVKEYSASAVLDWHLEQLNFARLNGAGKSLSMALMSLLGDMEIFWATPLELAEHWIARKRKLNNIN